MGNVLSEMFDQGPLTGGVKATRRRPGWGVGQVILQRLRLEARGPGRELTGGLTVRSRLVLGGPGEEGRLAREWLQLAPGLGAARLTSTRPDFPGGQDEPDIGVFV